MRLFIFLISLFLYSEGGSLYVSLTFDDGWDTHYASSLLLDSYQIKATYYINSNKINIPQRLTLTQMQNMSFNGHEIGGHTKDHLNLVQNNYTVQQEQICGDRAQLINWGFPATSFAFPFGADSNVSYSIITSCGYNSARDSGGLRSNSSCFSCPTGDSFPPRNPYLIRSISYDQTLGNSGMQWYITQAENEVASLQVDRWVILVFHEYDVFAPNANQGITVQNFTDLVVWLKTRPIPLQFRIMSQIASGKAVPILSDLAIDPSKQGKPFIAFTFDDGTSDHVTIGNMFETYNMQTTFLVPTDRIGQAGNLTLANLTVLQNQGHEIGTKGKTSPRLLTLTASQQQQEICDSKNYLETLGFVISSLAWPFGETNQTLKLIASNCGYTFARDVGGIKTIGSCDSCPTALTIPLNVSIGGDALELRSFSVKSTHTLGYLMWQIRQAEETGGDTQRVLVFTFGRVCSGCAFSPDVLQQLLIWLSSRLALGTRVIPLNKAVPTIFTSTPPTTVAPTTTTVAPTTTTAAPTTTTVAPTTTTVARTKRPKQ